MIKKRFFCVRCEEWIVLEVLEPGEAEAKRIRPVPVSCPNCRGPLMPDEQ